MTRQEQVDRLYEVRETLAAEINDAPPSRDGTQWLADRYAALKAVVEQMRALGA